MKTKYNMAAIITGLIIILLGVCMVLVDIFSLQTVTHVWISIGCSLIASGLVIVLNALLVNKIPYNPLDEWGIEKIYETRAEKNKDSDPKLVDVEHCIDAVAFGLSSFRNKHTKEITECLERGVQIRILTMDPQGSFVEQRSREENEVPEQIRHTINQLIDWADQLNDKGYKGKIIVKAYSCMTLDFYWRMDGELYVGPYWYGVKSQQTITYKFVEGKAGFKQFSKYFEDLWDDNSMKVLTKVKQFD
jgi:hypothetical protein